MVRYDDYKDSGINWIGEIPAEWRESRIGNIYDARNEKVSELDYAPLSVTMNGIVPQLETAAKTQDQDNRKLVKAGDFAINSRSDRRGSCGIAPCDGSVSLITNVLRPRRNVKMFDEYFEWLFHSEGFADEYYKYGTGIVDDLWSTNWSRMKKIAIPIPQIEDQKAISSYLNNRVGFTDSLIEKTTSSIDLLHEYRQSIITEAVTHGLDPYAPMKPSGIEWVGDIPTAWSIIPLKYIIQSIASGTSVNGAAWSADEQELGVLSLSSVFRGMFRPSENKQVEGTEVCRLTCPLEKGSLLISRCNTSEWVGTAAYVDKSYGNLYCPDKIWQLSFASGMQAKSIKYYLDSKPSRVYFESMSVGASSSMQNISKEDLLNIPIVIPDDAAQIVDYLDTKTAEIDALIASKERQVELLREYRKSIISEAVTGKFKVPGLE